MGDLFTARFADCRFHEAFFPKLGGKIGEIKRDILWKIPSSHLDPRASICEKEVQKIIHLQKIANQMPDAFTDLKRITKLYILAENVPIRIDISVGQSSSVITNESKAHLKHSRPLGSKDQNPRKRKINDQDDTMKKSHKKTHDLTNPEIHEDIDELETQENKELSINPNDIETNLNQLNIVVDYVFA
ncbi:uncharacterized protein [Nicotiana tomentosiformis]|uniref:uncharacterized protein n=1 Tax=Nicotiana tomentosiformis TaxID=4098 RepID=UPI00388C53B2